MLSESEIDKKATECIEMFKQWAHRPYPHDGNEELSNKNELMSATMCAIKHYEQIVDLWETVKHDVGLGDYIQSKRTESLAILNKLRDRL
jgi:hypothetical protein